MERKLRISSLILAISVASFVGCKPDPIVTDPPDPPAPPVAIPDCSHSFTIAAVDTNGFYPSPDPGGQQSYYHEGYELKDFSFNPNNPNELVMAVSLDRDFSGIGVQGDDVLIHYDLCSGEKHLIQTLIGHLQSVDWGENGVILYASGHDLATVLPDGGGYHLIPNDPNSNLIVEWLPDSLSFLTRGLFTYGMLRMDTLGNVLNENVGFPSTPGDLDVMPDGRVAYHTGSKVGIFNLDNETAEVIDDQLSLQGFPHIAYSVPDNALLYTSDTLLVRTEVSSGQQTVLATGFSNRRYSNVRATKNGYIAYIAHVGSPEMSTPSIIYGRTELRFINADGTDERRLVLDFE